MTDYLEFTGPAGLTTRGTVIVVPGRGESASTYRRFGSRIAADSYRVLVLAEAPAITSGEDASSQLAATLTDVVSQLGTELVRPLVLVGSDSGAAVLSALVSRRQPAPAWAPDALVLAALPGHGAHLAEGGWSAELDVRTHCPVHRGVLSEDVRDPSVSLGTALSADLLDLAYGNTSDIATLLLVGDADPLADHHALHSLEKGLPVARLSVVRAAHHDVLNDMQHRSVAAEVVAFLEMVRNGRPLTPVVSSSSTSW